MTAIAAALIAEGQLYFNDELNEYLVVTSADRGMVCYAGPGFSGRRDHHEFLDLFQPVDPVDLTAAEASTLTALSHSGELKIGVTQAGDDGDDDGE